MAGARCRAKGRANPISAGPGGPLAGLITAVADAAGRTARVDREMLLGITAVVGLQSRGMPVSVEVSGVAADAVARGEHLLGPENTAAFLEVHIEQGPSLDSEGLPSGIVLVINKQISIALGR